MRLAGCSPASWVTLPLNAKGDLCPLAHNCILVRRGPDEQGPEKGVKQVVEVWTANIRYSGPDRLDVTVKSGDRTFAPTWDLVMGYKQGKISEEEYTEKYTQLMRQSWVKNNKRWREVLGTERVVLVCYCRPGVFCHRVLLARMIEKAGGKYMGEIKL